MPTAGQLRFVVLRHDGYGPTHFDLMFEMAPGSKLATWRADHWPLLDNSRVTALSDHRADYLTYEGPLTNNRGSVTRITTGHHTILRSTNVILQVEFQDGATMTLPRAPAGLEGYARITAPRG